MDKAAEALQWNRFAANEIGWNFAGLADGMWWDDLVGWLARRLLEIGVAAVVSGEMMDTVGRMVTVLPKQCFAVCFEAGFGNSFEAVVIVCKPIGIVVDTAK